MRPQVVSSAGALPPWPSRPLAADPPSFHACVSRCSEKSAVIQGADELKITLVANEGGETVLRDGVSVDAGEVVDASVMSVKALRAFLANEIEDAREKGLLLSLPLKATMMKVSDPILFGHAVTVYFKDVFDKYADTFSELGVSPNNG